jgi:hypothetical protein
MVRIKTKINHKKVVKKSSQPKQLLILFILVCSFMTLLIYYINRLSLEKTGETNLPTQGLQPTSPTENAPSPTIVSKLPTPTINPIPLPQGKTYFRASTGDKTRTATLTEITFDPLDVKVGEKQVIDVGVSSKSKIKSVKIKIESDRQKTEISLTRISGSDSEGVWQGTLINKDSHKDIYNFIFTIENEQKQESYTVSLRG